MNPQQAVAGQAAPPAERTRRSGKDDFGPVAELVRTISRQEDPQAMIDVFRQHAPSLFGGDGSISLSRRGLEAPRFRITRSTRWTESINPWEQPHRLPLLEGGLLADLLYADEPRVLHNVQISPHDPAEPYLRNARSLLYLPLFEGGVGLNGVVRVSTRADGFDHVPLGDALLIANLFGRATSHLVLARQLQHALARLDHEMKRVAEIQRSLLPPALPSIPTLDIAVSYKTAAHAGGDYYDFFDLQDGRWGLLIADVSGHGTPAAVVMAMMRTMLHAQCRQRQAPGEVLCSLNRQLAAGIERYLATFVTAFYAIYDPKDRTLRYACAGHNPPLLVDRRIRVRELNDAGSYPLAVLPECRFPERAAALQPGDTLILYTDGVTEAVNDEGEPYGHDRLLSCVREDVPNAQHIVDCVVHKLLAFTGGKPQADDQTLVALRVQA